jgi:hypothetical protein
MFLRKPANADVQGVCGDYTAVKKETAHSLLIKVSRVRIADGSPQRAYTNSLHCEERICAPSEDFVTVKRGFQNLESPLVYAFSLN